MTRLPAIPILIALLSVAGVSGAATVADQRLEDIAQLREEFLARDRAYSADARRAAEAMLAELERTAATIEAAEFDLGLARVVALADNGHTTTFAGPRSRRYERSDLRLVPFGEQFHVLRVKTENADLLGARLVAIDGVPVERLRELGRSLVGGTAAWRDRSIPYLLESPPQLRALGVGKRGAAPVYRFLTLEGREVERSFSVSPPGGDRVRGNANRWMFPALAPAEDRSWRTLIEPERAPWALQEPTRRLRFRHDPALDAVVVEMRQSSDPPGETLSDFFAAVEQAIAETRPAHLVLDLRMNTGGDLTATRDFAEQLPTLVPGRVFALTSPFTFSAAISTLGYLKQAAPDRVTIVGEMVGDRLEFFAEGRPVTLRHSQEVVLMATQRHDYVNGCRAFDDCQRHVVSRPIAVRSLAPDIAAPWTIEAYRAARDPAMEAVAAALASR